MRQGLFGISRVENFIAKEAVMDGILFGAKHIFLDKVPRIGQMGQAPFGRKVMP